MSHVDIDLAERADVPHALSFANWAAEHTTANFALAPEDLGAWQVDFDRHHAMYPWLIARRGGLAAGFAKAAPHRARGAYAWTTEVTVYVEEASHGRGIGTALYRVLLPLLRAQGYMTLLAGIATPHVPSERLHASFGFTRCATFHRMGWKLGAWRDVSYWELQLQPDPVAPGPVRPVREAWTHLGK